MSAARGIAAAASPWLAVIGLGEDGAEGIGEAARRVIAGASLVVGGARHLALAGALIRGEALAWPRPMTAAYPAILARRARIWEAPPRVAVLASGDPFWFGIGASLADLVEPGEMLCLPTASSLSLACARLGWALQDVSVVSLCGRPLATIAPVLHHGRRVLILSADGTTPDAVAALLARTGFGRSRLHVFERLGGPSARHLSALAADGVAGRIAPLNLVAIEVEADPGAAIIPLTSGMADDRFENDGQLTRAEVRAITLAALAPCRGECLWDVGSGSGSIGIEWMLRDPSCTAIAIDQRPDRLARAARNAEALGVPGLVLREGRAPDAFAGLAMPDAIFLGGGGREWALIDAAHAALRPGGRLVANSVTIETDAALTLARARLGGSLTRIGIERLDEVGGLHGYRPAMTVTQWRLEKPARGAGVT